MRNLSILLDNKNVEIQPDSQTLLNRQPDQPARAGWHRYTCPAPQPRLAEPRYGAQPTITAREIQVLKFVAEGLTNRQTAVELSVSVKTVQKHRQSVMNKLNLHDTASLTRYAVAWGILFDNVSSAFSRQRHSISEDWWLPQGAIKWITARETQVLKLIAQGLVNKQIASELNISIKTVENHRQGLMNRLNIHDVAGLTRYAISQGLIASAVRAAAWPSSSIVQSYVSVPQEKILLKQGNFRQQLLREKHV